MRHKRGNKKLSKPTDQRIALIRSLAIALILNKKIESTYIRLHEARKVIEKLVTLSKENTLHSRRQALKILPSDYHGLTTRGYHPENQEYEVSASEKFESNPHAKMQKFIDSAGVEIQPNSINDNESISKVLKL